MMGNMIVLIATCKDDFPAEMRSSMPICILLYRFLIGYSCNEPEHKAM